MNPDLERLIRLQELDTFSENARRQITETPARIEALESRLASHADALGATKMRLADNQTRRRAVEKDLATMQARLSKFKDQLMEVKTNKEYQAMQKEIAVAEGEVRSLEDQILERMLEADELTTEAKAAEAELAAEQTAVAEARRAIEQERDALDVELGRAAEERRRLVAAISPAALGLFEYIARGRKGVAVTEARDGHCGVCHVRLRPQVFNEIRSNDSIIQCESCQRILYFVVAPVT